MSSDKRLLSGSLLLAPDGNDVPSLGIVSGETPLVGTGHVQITLDPARCKVQLEHEVSLRMAETDAKAIAEAVRDTCSRLEHLRALNKGRKLDASALLDAAVASRRPTVRAGKGRALVPMASVPAAADQPMLCLRGTQALLSYRDVVGKLIEIRFASVVVVRSVSDASAPETARVYRVDGDPWRSVAIGAADPKDTDLEHYLVSFIDANYEIIAQSFELSIASGKDST